MKIMYKIENWFEAEEFIKCLSDKYDFEFSYCENTLTLLNINEDKIRDIELEFIEHRFPFAKLDVKASNKTYKSIN